MDQTHYPWLLVVVLAALALAQTVRLRRWRSRPGRRARRRLARAREGELAAEALLTREGFRVLDRQVPGTAVLTVDGDPMEVGIRADYLVERARRRYVAEVKTGAVATHLRHGPTRRQLLEYGQAFGVEAVLLVDAEQGRVHRVSFPPRVGPGRRAGLLITALVLALGTAAGWLLRSSFGG